MAGDRDGKRRNRWVIGIVALVAVVVGVTIGAVVVSSQSSSAAPAITLVPANSPGPDPFTQSAASGEPTGTVTVSASVRQGLKTDPNTKTLVAAGTAPGLYGGSGDVHVCDAQKLVTFLNANPAKARAWASVFHIAPKEIGSYVATLTPVVLTADTFVTNHGYRNGQATTLQAVLQAGTAVMVDKTGTPRVKCNCGNPLLPPVPVDLSAATLHGVRWTGYAPVNVTIIETGTTVNNFTLTNIETGATYVEAAGSDTGSGGSGEWVATEVSDAAGGKSQTTIVTSHDGTTWTTASVVPDEKFTGLAYGDGKWIAVSQNYNDISTATHILESTDLHTWTKVTGTPETLVGIGHANGQWVAVGSWPAGVAVGGLDHATPAVYRSADGTSWTQEDPPDGPDDGSNMRGLISVAHGSKGWRAIGINETDNPQGGVPGYKLTTLTSADGSTWTAAGTGIGVGDPRAAIANGGATWAESMFETSGKGVLSTGPDGTSWALVDPTAFATHPVSGLAYGGGSWLAVSTPHATSDGTPPANPTSTFFTSTDLKHWKQAGEVPALVTAVAYGGAAGTSDTSTTAPAQQATGQPPCTRAALQDALGHDPEDDIGTAIINSYDAPICADGWAAVHYGNQGRYVLAVFRANGSAWTRPADDLSTRYPVDPDKGEGSVQTWHSLCTDPEFPNALHVYACPGS